MFFFNDVGVRIFSGDYVSPGKELFKLQYTMKSMTLCSQSSLRIYDYAFKLVLTMLQSDNILIIDFQWHQLLIANTSLIAFPLYYTAGCQIESVCWEPTLVMFVILALPRVWQ